MREILTIESLCAGYGGRVIVNGISLRVSPGRITTLIGPNGAGKSTILRTIAGQIAPIDGVIRIAGADRDARSGADVARIRAVMMTERPAAEQMTCEEVVSVGRTPHTGRLGILSEHDREVVREAMALVRVADLADRDIRQLSDGQRQRILLARAIAQEPKLMILDEPTSYLDVRHKLEFLDLLEMLARERQIGILMSMHELEFARAVSDEIICVDAAGEVRSAGAPDEILTDALLSDLYGTERGRITALYEGFLRAIGDGGAS